MLLQLSVLSVEYAAKFSDFVEEFIQRCFQDEDEVGILSPCHGLVGLIYGKRSLFFQEWIISEEPNPFQQSDRCVLVICVEYGYSCWVTIRWLVFIFCSLIPPMHTQGLWRMGKEHSVVRAPEAHPSHRTSPGASKRNENPLSLTRSGGEGRHPPKAEPRGNGGTTHFGVEEAKTHIGSYR